MYWRIAMFKNYLKIALRNFFKHKGYSFINIAGLAVGIACCSLIFLWVKDELSYDKFHDNIDEIYRVILDHEGQWWTSSPWAFAPILKQNYPEVLKSTRYAGRTRLLRYGEHSYYEQGALVDEDFFEIFTFPFIQGDPQTALSALNTIVLTEEAAEKYFPSEDPMGKVLIMNNETDLTVTGVIKNVPSNSTIQFDFLAPVRLIGEERLNSWALESWSFLLMKKGASADDFIEKISGLVMEYDRRTDQKVLASIQPFSRIYLYSLSGTGPILYVYIFSIIALLILLIACINFMNLATARAGNRAKEIGMRKVVGAYKANIIRQFYSESMLSSFIALLLAILLVYLFLPSFNTLSSKQLTLDIAGNLSTILGLIGITVFTGFVSGSYPALILSSFKAVTVLKGSLSSVAKSSPFRKILVVSQFTATVVLIICTAIMYKQLDYIRKRDLGFDRDHVVIIPLSAPLRQNYGSFRDTILQNSDIINVTCATSVPTGVGNINPVYWEGRTSEQYETWNWVAVDYDYFETFNMEMVDGRSFSREFSTDQQNYIVNEEAVKHMELESPIGKLFSIWTNEGKIVGVVKNFHSRSLHNEIVPVAFTLGFRWSLSRIFVKIKPDNIPDTIAYLKNTTLQFGPNFPFEYTFLDEYFEGQYRADQQIGTIFKYFALIAVLISCLGLFGLAAFMAEQRTKEIGVRKVLGASITNIITLLSKEFLLLISIANLISWPAAYFIMKRMLSRYAYRTDMAFWIFLTAGILTLFITFLTVSVQTLKAARANPVEALKYE